MASRLSRLARASKYYSPIEISNDARLSKVGERYRENFSSKSHRLMLEMGLIAHATGKGLYNLLPLCQRVLDKLVTVIDYELQMVGCQKMTMPSLVRSDLMQQSGRWDNLKSELFSTVDHEKREYCLAPTHEEVITKLFAKGSPYSRIGERRLPLMLYQITPKFRSELRPAFGLLRTREFLMKDLYTFDCSVPAAEETFKLVESAYGQIFKRLNLPYRRTQADTGSIGGLSSAEYHLPCSVGQDLVFTCTSCSHGVSSEVLFQEKQVSKDVKKEDLFFICDACRKGNLMPHKSIELAHLFLLGTRYSEAFQAQCTMVSGELALLQMGCYGIGVTRLIAACVEHFSTDTQLRFPMEIVPFKICIIGPKKGSREQRSFTQEWEDILAETFSKEEFFGNDVILDDRTKNSVGYRVADAKRIGIPYIVVANKAATRDPPEFEVIDVYNDDVLFLDHLGLLDYFSERRNFRNATLLS